MSQTVTKNGSAQQTVTPGAGALARQEFGATQMEVRSETASAAMAAYAQATVQARFIMAERKPRNIERARFRIMEAAKRPKFADEAIYNKPIGEGIEGPSIRLAEALVRELGNILVDVTPISDDREKRILSIVATDLESNATYSDIAVVEKTVERRNSEGYEVLGERTNKFGKTVYIVRATDDDILNKQAAVVSKKIRTATLRLVPADILEEAMQQCRDTLQAETEGDLPGVRQRVIAGFGMLKPPVSPEDLTKYLGRDVARATPAEVLELRKLGVAIRDGEATWAEALEQRIRLREAATQAPKPPAETPASLPAAAQPVPPPPAQAQPEPEKIEKVVAKEAKPAEVVSFDKPNPVTGEVPLDPVEAEIDAILKGAKNGGDAFKALPKIRALPVAKQEAWRKQFNARMEELANVSA